MICMPITVWYSDFWIIIFLIVMRHTVLDQEKNSKNVVEKAIFYILSGFFPNWGFLSKNFTNGPVRKWTIFFLK